jgi:hypothetical protein
VLTPQQTPSTQRPAEHWLLAVHASPIAPALRHWLVVSQ